MRRLGSVLVLTLLASCSLLPPPAGIQVTIPAAQGVPALPVTIVDHASIVRGAAPAGRTNDVSSDTTVHAVAGRDDQVLLTWIGGACDDRAIVTIDRDAGRYRVSVTSDSSATACSAVGIFRTLLLDLTEHVGADAFRPG